MDFLVWAAPTELIDSPVFFIPDWATKTVSLYNGGKKHLAMGNKDGDDPKPGLQESLGDLVARCGGRVQRFIERRLRGASHQSVDDVAQETYLRLLRMPPSAPVENPEAYILQVAANVIKDSAMRDARERERISFDSDDLDKVCERVEHACMDHAQNALEAEQELARIKNTLPPILLATLVLRKRDGLSYEQIAQRLGKSPHTIKKYLSEAIARCVALRTAAKTRGTVR